ncbi:MAG: hypothetical protein BV456_12590 [Thermoplasmata archaeon M8B2D]|nr:MAG: hypothetical protein BV456_12590 [Thermoplasmata archaeon M8B2D]
MTAKKKKNNFMVSAAILITLIIVLSGVYYGVIYFGENPKQDNNKKTNIPVIDDQISPGGNQALIVEINRIRNRGIIDAMLSGIRLPNPPSFYYTCTRDGNTFVSKDVFAAGGASSELLFVTWDSMFQENRLQEDIEEEQETVDVSISIIEREPSGLLGRKYNDVEKEKIDVTYDFRTGRWTGDDYFLDDDGYGHFRGDTFEVWFYIYQTDVDGDKIPYWTEVNVLGTDPLVDDSNLDPDNDGIPTAWEWYWGYDPFTWDDHENLDPDIDGIENIEEYQMRKYFADPYNQDIYIEVDGMEKGGLIDPPHVFTEEAAQIMIERFASNGINMYIDNGWPDNQLNGGGELLTHYDTISQDSGVMLQFYRHNFADNRKGIFRYMIVGHNAGFCIPSELNRYDTLVIDSSLYKIFLKRGAFTPRTQSIVLSAAAMHELGHSLGIAPWTFQGNDNLTFAEGRAAKQEYENTWGDYYSVMNYLYIWDKNLADYSDGRNGPPYDQNDWEHFYLPTFEVDVNAVEDPTIEPPATDRLVNETPEPLWDNWYLEENLTIDNKASIDKICYVENVDAEYRVYVPEIYDENIKNGTYVRVYAKPDTGATYSQWSLIAEGILNDSGIISFYSIDEKIDWLWQYID